MDIDFLLIQEFCKRKTRSFARRDRIWQTIAWFGDTVSWRRGFRWVLWVNLRMTIKYQAPASVFPFPRVTGMCHHA